jgi:hypothetical protein
MSTKSVSFRTDVKFAKVNPFGENAKLQSVQLKKEIVIAGIALIYHVIY